MLTSWKAVGGPTGGFPLGDALVWGWERAGISTGLRKGLGNGPGGTETLKFPPATPVGALLSPLVPDLQHSPVSPMSPPFGIPVTLRY